MKRISPTRIALLTLRKEREIAVRGHKLLKDKRDGLIREFVRVVRDSREKRRLVDQKLGSAFAAYERASVMSEAGVLERALAVPSGKVTIDVIMVNIMSVKVPRFHVAKEGSAVCYGLVGTPGDLDAAIIRFEALFLDLVRLAEMEKTIERLAQEIETTRRRVSALENILIPELEEKIKFVAMQLEERARGAVVTTMRIKAMILEKEGA